MARGVNKVILVGNCGSDPEMRFMPQGGAVTNLSIATSESWKDKQTGQQQERTEWHRVVFFNRLAEIAGEYLKKGSKVYVEGSLRTRKWQDQSGQDKYTTEIVASEMQMLDSRGVGQGGYGDSYGQPQSYSQAPAANAGQGMQGGQGMPVNQGMSGQGMTSQPAAPQAQPQYNQAGQQGGANPQAAPAQAAPAPQAPSAPAQSAPQQPMSPPPAQHQQAANPYPTQQQAQAPQSPPAQGFDDFDDDIPF